jgi:hypothetical protein
MGSLDPLHLGICHGCLGIFYIALSAFVFNYNAFMHTVDVTDLDVWTEGHEFPLFEGIFRSCGP